MARTYTTTVTLHGDDAEGVEQEYEVEVEIAYSAGYAGCFYTRNGDPGDPPEPPEVEVLRAVRLDTGAEIDPDLVDLDTHWDSLVEAAEDAEAAAYEDAMEARAEARREREMFGEDW